MLRSLIAQNLGSTERLMDGISLMGAVSGNDRFVTLEAVDLNEVPDGYVIYHNEQVHYLNTTAAVIYQLLDGHHTVDEVADLLKQVFNQADDVDIATSVQNMLEAELICRVE